MTILAGAIARGSTTLDPSVVDAMRNALARGGRDVPSVVSDSRACLLKIDVGAYGVPAEHRSASGTTAMLAGALLRDDRPPAPRDAELARAHGEWERGDWSALAAARGTFAASLLDPSRATIDVATDKLGIRPVFVATGERYTAFATAMHVIEALPGLTRPLDVRAVTEMVCLGYPLADRTPYTNVIALRAGEIATLSAAGVARRTYWRWDDVATSMLDESALADEAHERFIDAVRLRLRDDTTTAAFLSGGLDSRCVVAALRSLDASLHTFNFSPSDSQDRIFAADYAAVAGVTHVEVTPSAGTRRWSQMIADAWRDAGAGAGTAAVHPRLVWSGDGGSVGCGLVYMTRDVVTLLRAGRRDEALRHFLEERRAAIPRRLLAPELVARLGDVIYQGLREELDRVEATDPAHALHLVLMLNDQRRHLSAHFETIDEHRLELQLPFFDSRFLETMLSVPVDSALEHRFYSVWLSRFPAPTISVPWQTYPGHVPCPLPRATAGSYQWAERDLSAMRRAERRTLVRDAIRLLRDDVFPRALLRRPYLWLATLAHGSGLRDYDYVLRMALAYAEQAKRSNG